MVNIRGIREIRGQVTVFILLAVVLVVAAGIAFLMSNKSNDSGFDKEFSTNPEIQAQFNKIKTGVQDCMKFVCEDAMNVIGIQGGYYKQPKEVYDLGGWFIPYYYNEGSYLMPQNSEIENQLGLYVDDHITSCFDEVNGDNFRISYTTPKTSVTMNKGEVVFEIDNGVSVSRDDKTVKFDLKASPVKEISKLYEMTEIAKYITDSHKEDANLFCVNCVSDMAEERDVFVDMIDFGEPGTTLVVISSNSSITSYSFEFLNKYPSSE